MSSSISRHRVVIVGSRFGGLAAAKALRRAPVDVAVIDRTNHHLFQSLLYQMATGVPAEGDIAPPTRDILRRHANTSVLLGEVVDVDLEARVVTLETIGRSARVAYDSLIVAAGAGQSYFGHDEFGEHAPGMKTIDDALELRGRIFGAFELAELEREESERDAWLTIAVVGAGPTGVEVAGQIAELSRRALKRNFRRFDPAQARVILLDAVDTVLPSFPGSLRRRAHRDLERLGIEIELATRVTGVDERGLDVVRSDGSSGRIEARTKVWAAGVKASALGARLGEQSGAAVDRSGRVAVLADCTLPGHPEVFVIGDLMSLNDLPGVAEVAMQSGRHAARSIVRRLRGDDTTREFRYRDLGTMAHGLPLPGRRLVRSGPPRRARGLAALARHTPRLPHRLQESSGHAGQLDRRVPRPWPARAHDHRATGLRPNTQLPPRESSKPRDDGSPGRLPGSCRTNPKQEGRDVNIEPRIRDTFPRRSVPARRWAGT